MSRKERLEVLGDKAKKFTNVYIKNFSEDLDDKKLEDIFEEYGTIVSAKVSCAKNKITFSNKQIDGNNK